mgnify:CR=1 FL=1
MAESLSDLRKRRDTLTTRIYMKKRAGKDATDLENELAQVRDAIKNYGSSSTSSSSTSSSSTSSSMSSHSKDYQEGYQAAIEAIKKAIKNQGSGNNGQGAPESDGDEDLQQPPVPGQKNQPGQGNQSKGGSDNDGNGGGGRNSDEKINGSDNVGQVQPSDCSDISGSKQGGNGGTPGGMIRRADGDKIAKAEGYPDNGKGEDAQAQDFAETAIKEASKLQGGGAGGLRAKIEGMYKTNTDWKAALRKVVGRSINAADTRQAYANKNVLTSQDRIARTDKDKYDCVDYIIAALDTSGSISDDQLKLMLMETYQVALKKKPVKIYIIYCDTAMSDIEEFNSPRELKNYITRPNKKIHGGGGTEFQPLWGMFQGKGKVNDKSKAILQKWSRSSTELLMLFTDGYCTQYKRDARHMQHLCWVILDNPGFNVQYKDPNTFCVYINSSDVK